MLRLAGRFDDEEHTKSDKVWSAENAKEYEVKKSTAANKAFLAPIISFIF
jgi:hypothetical protein